MKKHKKSKKIPRKSAKPILTWIICRLSLVTVTLITHLLNWGSVERSTW